MSRARTGGLARALLLGAALPSSACGGAAAGSQLEEHAVDRAMAPYGIDLAPAELPSVTLGWQPPPEPCPHAYRITTAYEPDLRFEADGTSSLVLGRHPRYSPMRVQDPPTRSLPEVGAKRRPPEVLPPLEPGPIPAGVVVPLLLYYRGVRAERVGASRSVALSVEQAGPAAPTAACLPRSWDPMEDALTLGWPRLPGRLVAVGERWSGLPVQGKCARSPCVSPETGGGGATEHARTCVTAPWQEQLAGLYVRDGELYAWITSRWSDGHPAGQGIHTERSTLVSVEHGRPVWSQTVVDHRFPQPVASGGFAPVVRTWTIEAIDGCPGSLAAAGWERPAALVEEEAALRERLAHADDLRQSDGDDEPAWPDQGAAPGGGGEPAWPEQGVGPGGDGAAGGRAPAPE